MKVLEKEKIIKYLKKRKLVKQYLKAKLFMESGQYKLVDLRKRQPTHLNKFYFKINDQYRAFGFVNEQNQFIVTEISDHQ